MSEALLSPYRARIKELEDKLDRMMTMQEETVGLLKNISEFLLMCLGHGTPEAQKVLYNRTWGPTTTNPAR